MRLCWSSRRGERAGLSPDVEHELVLEGTRYLGSGPGDAIRIDREGIAPRHLALEPRGGGVWLRARGTALLDGVNILREARLPDGGGLVRVGAAELALRCAPADVAIEGSPVLRALLGGAPAAGDLLIEGERGAGRRTLARAIHERDRPGAPLVVLDCRSFWPERIDAVLFGIGRHGNPPPPGASDLHYWGGVIASAGSGTLVLSEIGALPAEAQAWLAHVLARRPPANHGIDGRQTPFAARVIVTVGDGRPLAPALEAQLAPGGRRRVPALRERTAELGPMLRGFGAGELSAALRERLARLRWPRNAAQLRGVALRIARGSADEAVAEAELLEAIEDEPAADGPRLVYGDLLVARGDPRGELIQVQCRLADPSAPADLRRRLAVRERELLDVHGSAWTAPLVDGARVEAATLSRGFVEAVRGDREILRVLDLVLEQAPLVGALHLDPALHPGHPWPARFDSPLLARLHTLRASCSEPADELAVELAACPHLAGLRMVAFSTGATAARGRVHVLGGIGARALAGSRHLAGVTSLVLDGGLLSGEAIAGVLGPAAWTLRRLTLARLLLEEDALAALVAAPGLGGLARLELHGCELSPDAAARLAAAHPGVELDIG